MDIDKIRGRPQTSGYSEAGASLTRRALKGFMPRSGSPNEDINDNNQTLRQRSRMLYMASPVATSAINTSRTKVVGTGLTLKSDIDRTVLGLSPEEAKDWQRNAEAEFALWAEKKQNCDALGVNNFSGIQQLAVKSWLTSGDVFVVIQRAKPTPLNPYTLRLHMVEADRCSTPLSYGGSFLMGSTEGVNQSNNHKIHDGVEVDAKGAIIAYYIRNTYPFQTIPDETHWDRIAAYGKKTGLPNILHIMDSERPDQYRGVPYLAQVIEPLLQLRRYTESQLTSAIIQSFFTAWIKTETDPTLIPFNETGPGDSPLYPEPGGDGISHSESEYEMGPGQVVHLKDGEDIVFGHPEIPAASFESFVKTICREVGAALEIPYDVLLKEFDSSYSASRGALLEAWEGFRMKRTWLTDALCQPVYEIWLSEAVALGRIKAPGFWDDPLVRAAWCKSRWIGPTQGSLDPKKEAAASLSLISHGLKTHEQVAIEIGGEDWNENVEQLARENELLAEATKYEVPDAGLDSEGTETQIDD